ncbi:flagellar hook-basal body complex protein FliE [Desulfothermus okinawensis JCM 13304]
MAINSIAQAAYLSNLRDKDLIEQGSRNVGSSNSFKSTVEESLKKVNELQLEKDKMIEEFAVGKNENVHEVMIALQKADVAIKLTSAVRNKVIEAYKQLINMPL